jgi:hypothetical protein
VAFDGATIGTVTDCMEMIPTGTIGTWLCGPAGDINVASDGAPLKGKYLPGSCRITGLDSTVE